MTRIPWMLTVAALTALLSAGCGGARPVPVQGVVTFDGSPLADAAVRFISQEPGGRDATGFTDEQGAFQLTTFRQNDGALPGLYKVTVRYSKAVKAQQGKGPADAQKSGVQVGGSPKAPMVIPPVYSRPDMTILKHRVPDDGHVKLDLRSGKL